MRTRVKICGITSAEDALAAVDAGADAIGVVLAPSPRRVTLDEAAKVFSVVPPLVSRVGVFVDPTLEQLSEAARRLRLDLVQLSGDESPELCKKSPVPVLKVIQVGTTFDAYAVEPYRGLVAAFVFDTHVTGKRGGTGETFSWHTLHEIPAGPPLCVAGQTLQEIGMPHEIAMRHRMPQFGHLFQGDGYSAGYYSYLWSDVMAADTWEMFTQSGNVFDPTIAASMRNVILGEANNTDRTEAYRRFRGRDPDVNALLRDRGMPTTPVAGSSSGAH